MNDLNQTKQTDLRNSHQCFFCGGLVRVDAPTANDLMIEIFECPTCGQSEPLNLENVPCTSALSKPDATINVLLVDDHPVVRSGLQAMLSAGERFAVVGISASAEEAILHKGVKPDVIVMDMRMPGLEGDDAISAVHKALPTARILVLTNYDEDHLVSKALQAGALGYLLKNSSQPEIFDAIEKVYAGERALPEHISRRLLQAYGRAELSNREIEVLNQVARGLSNRGVAEALYISEKTVRNHITSCILKLGVTDRTGAVTTALKRGLLSLRD